MLVFEQVVADMMVRMRRELGTDDNPIPPEIDQIILLDRAVDLITPMCSQLTYEGLIDEVYSIQNSTRVAAAAAGYAAHPNPDVGVPVSFACLSRAAAFVDLEPAITGFKEKRKVAMTSADSLYRMVRNV